MHAPHTMAPNRPLGTVEITDYGAVLGQEESELVVALAEHMGAEQLYLLSNFRSNASVMLPPSGYAATVCRDAQVRPDVFRGQHRLFRGVALVRPVASKLTHAGGAQAHRPRAQRGRAGPVPRLAQSVPARRLAAPAQAHRRPRRRLGLRAGARRLGGALRGPRGPRQPHALAQHLDLHGVRGGAAGQDARRAGRAPRDAKGHLG